MLEESEKQQKASRILKKFSITKVFTKLLDRPYDFASSSAITYSVDVKSRLIENLVSGASLTSADQEIVLGVSSFRSSYAPDSDSSVADAYIYFDGELVLQTSASKEYSDWGSSVDILDYPFSIKVFKAGPWLELLGKWHGEVREAGRKRQERDAEESRKKRDKEQESKFDFGDYE